MEVIRVFIVIFVMITSTALYRKASGTLSLQRINAISYSYYLLMITSLIGGSAVFLGFRKHYVLAMLKGNVAVEGYCIIAYTLIALPLFIILFNRMMGIKDYDKYFRNYINRGLTLTTAKEKSVFSITVIVSAICTISVIYTLYHVGFIALVELLKGRFYLLASGVLVNRGFSGNVYIRNIFALGFTPILSYFAYVFYRCTNKVSWKILFWYLFALSILVKTYDFSKAPLVIYLFFFYIIKVLLGDVHNIKQFFKYGGVAVALILAIYYCLVGYNDKLLSFTNGPLSRLMVSQIAGLFMHVQIFPDMHQFLNGASFPKTIALLFGLKDYGIRSGRLVMEILYPASAADNSSGVMNTLFAAEAYANYGIIGVIIAPVIVAFCMSVILNLILRQEKNPFSISIYILFTYCYEQALVGGFVDFIYNVVLVLLFLLLLIMQIVVQGGKLKIRLSEKRG